MSLLDRQMLFVTGKGGVGKTTVAAALALAAAESGKKTIVAEVGGAARAARLLGGSPGAPGEERQVGERLWTHTIEPYKVMEEWIAKILGSRALTGVLTRSNFFRAFADAAPGGMELGTVVKAWELAQRPRWDKRARAYDLVIVDGPASGHAIGMLRTPGTFADIARVGPIATQSQRVREWLEDYRETAYVAVALPGELPVTETLEMGKRLRRSLGRRLETIVVNGVLPDRFTADDIEHVRKAAGRRKRAKTVLTEVRQADGRAENQHEQLTRLESEADCPIHELPFLFSPALEPADVAGLAEVLAPAL
ncbi:MAG TPA: ArsA-related P-loop ATPase [Solirubrobacteraceae bacterium]|nr:ArsA-related P-loop ATPase [Solirubrobacteraceae bacterium]